MLLRIIDYLWHTLLPNDKEMCQRCGEMFHRSLLTEGEETFEGTERRYVACESCYLASLELWVQQIREALEDKDSPYYAAYQEILKNE